MPPKNAATRDLVTDQLLYAMILQVGPPSGHEAWTAIAECISDAGTDRAASQRWDRLKARWDAAGLFGDDHFDLIAKFAEARGKPIAKKERKKSEGGKKGKAVAKGKGKEKEGSESGQNPDHDDDGGEGNSRMAGAEHEEVDEPVVKKKVAKMGKFKAKKAPVETADQGEESTEDMV